MLETKERPPMQKSMAKSLNAPVGTINKKINRDFKLKNAIEHNDQWLLQKHVAQ